MFLSRLEENNEHFASAEGEIGPVRFPMHAALAIVIAGFRE